jgi:hypothetical protein
MSPGVTSWNSGRRWPQLVLYAMVVAAIGAGAWTGYPIFSDAILPLLVHDSGDAGSLAAKHADRPLYGWMVQATVSLFGFHRLGWIVVSIAAWCLLAWLTSRLFRRVFPERSEWSWLPALLVLSPIVVQTQYVSITVAYPGVIPVALVLAGLLVGMGGPGSRRVAGVFLLGALAAGLSEYGIAAGFAGAVLAFGLRERRAALVLAAGVGCGAVIFHLTSDFSNRPDVTADEQLPKLAAAPVAALYRWLTGTWHAAIGAYGGAIWRPELDVKARSSLAFAVLGIVGAILAAVAASRSGGRPEDARDERPARLRLVFLFLAVAAAVFPVAAAGRGTPCSAAWTGEYETRFLLPALPFASLLLAGALARGFTPSLAPAAAALLGFVCVVASWNGALQAMLAQRYAERLGKALLPHVRSGDGIVIAVGEDDARLRWGSILTGKMTASWRDEEARRVWAMARSRASRVIGARAGCRQPDTIVLDEETRWIRRKGRLSELIWVAAGDRADAFEPYCLEARAP